MTERIQVGMLPAPLLYVAVKLILFLEIGPPLLHRARASLGTFIIYKGFEGRTSPFSQSCQTFVV
ncbi:MAG: hypothetical protein RR288_04485, partial [Oscillibacter sp.]